MKKPIRRDIIFGESANFSCSAVGSYISLSWMIDGAELICNADRCDNSAAKVTQQITGSNVNTRISSILEIDSTMLRAPANSHVTYHVTCVASQRIPDVISMQLQGSAADRNVSALLGVGKLLEECMCKHCENL